MTQARKGPRLPLNRLGEAILAGSWLSTQLGRRLYAAEAQTFGRMVYDEWAKTHPGTLPYTVRVDSSQKTLEEMPYLGSGRPSGMAISRVGTALRKRFATNGEEIEE